MQRPKQNQASLTTTAQEADRALTICNACRYCEGHCAVFQAIELRTEFNANSLDYLANLCHNCGSCFHHCQYAEPHEFNVNIPAVMAELRQENYRTYAWPAVMGRAFSNNGVWMLVLSIVMIAGFLGITSIEPGDEQLSLEVEHPFYSIIPHETLVGIFGGISVLVAIALISSMARFWRAMGLPGPSGIKSGRVVRALGNVLTLKYLDGGNGQGCSYPTERPSLARRWYHQVTFYGFLSCFAATSVGAIYHYVFEWQAPYGYTSLPKVLGILGGVGLLLGPAGLMWLKFRAKDAPGGNANKGMDASFLTLLFLASLTGLVLMVMKDTRWVNASLGIHLGVVLTLFLAMPYGKFIHGFYRLIALIAFAVEKHDRKPLM